MRLLLQRVTRAEVRIGGERVGSIGAGLLALVGFGRQDGPDLPGARTWEALVEKTLDLRVFPGEGQGAERMDRSLRETEGGLLLVSQFTLAADTKSGMRPSFSSAAPPAQGAALFDYLLARAGAQHAPVASGRFGADMQVHLINDGPVTFLLEV